MPTLRELIETIQRRPGVQTVVLLGTDGLVIETHTSAHDAAEALAARAPAVVSAARQLGSAAGAGDAQFVLVEFDHGYGILLQLSPQAVLLVSADPDVNLGELLFDIRRHRTSIAAIL